MGFCKKHKKRVLDDCPECEKDRRKNKIKFEINREKKVVEFYEIWKGFLTPKKVKFVTATISFQTIKDVYKMINKKKSIIIFDKIKEIVKNMENPYPKDVFKWNNREKLKFNRGRFNKFAFETVENTKNKIIELIKDEQKDLGDVNAECQ